MRKQWIKADHWHKQFIKADAIQTKKQLNRQIGEYKKYLKRKYEQDEFIKEVINQLF